MNIYERNVEFLQDKVPSIYNILMIEKARYDSKVNLITDSLNLYVENEGEKCFIHSTYDVEREFFRMFSSVDKNAERVVIFGFSIGKCIDYICNNFKNLNNITIIEPDLNIFKVMLNSINISELTERVGKITFIINKSKEEATEILWDCLNNKLTEKVELVYNIPYRSLYPEYFEYVINMVTSKIREYLLNISTDEIFRFKWAENIIKNNKHSVPLLVELSGKFKDIPVILVSAGPSLNYNIQYLKQINDKSIIFALGSAIKILDSNGIVPHFRLAFDGSEAERNVFKNIDTKASTLIFSDMLNYNIVNEYKGNKLRMVLNTDYISQYIQYKVYGNNNIFDSGFSVANVALDVVLKLGFEKIIFLGQDLCYTEGNVHAKGTWRQENNEVNFDESKFIKTINVIGETVYTDRSFLGMRDKLEQKIKINNGITYINATERGLNIEGTINKTFSDVMKVDLNNTFNIEDKLDVLFNEFNKDKKESDKLKVVNLTIINELKDIIKINEDRIKRIKKLEKYCEKGLGINKLMLELKYIQNIEYELDNSDFYKKTIGAILFNKFKIISMHYAYTGKDDKIFVEKNLKALLGQTLALKGYLSFILDLLEE